MPAGAGGPIAWLDATTLLFAFLPPGVSAQESILYWKRGIGDARRAWDKGAAGTEHTASVIESGGAAPRGPVDLPGALRRRAPPRHDARGDPEVGSLGPGPQHADRDLPGPEARRVPRHHGNDRPPAGGAGLGSHPHVSRGNRPARITGADRLGRARCDAGARRRRSRRLVPRRPRSRDHRARRARHEESAPGRASRVGAGRRGRAT